MNCVVTAGPTYESLDEVRRLTNFSTGRLGTELAAFLSARGHGVTLLIGQLATYRGERQARKVETFTTTSDLRERLRNISSESPDAVFHAAAVSDFGFGKIWRRTEGGDLSEVKSGKISTGAGTRLAELVPTPKIIAELRGWFPQARLTGWKYEVEGNRADVIALGERQIAECRTDACVVNGRGYGDGFGLVAARKCVHLPDMAALFDALEKSLQK
ncbi:MAG TPA: phosphopantothenoylcysteine decarboxylase [Verrucomicrobiae bacterium]|jgi:phosphopantothenoylcysteine synthetase/decarboxylase|nr:phosphopantothenoylcysteine decarboxylase [Verrucomicrobiae bacterium]